MDELFSGEMPPNSSNTNLSGIGYETDDEKTDDEKSDCNQLDDANRWGSLYDLDSGSDSEDEQNAGEAADQEDHRDDAGHRSDNECLSPWAGPRLSARPGR